MNNTFYDIVVNCINQQLEILVSSYDVMPDHYILADKLARSILSIPGITPEIQRKLACNERWVIHDNRGNAFSFSLKEDFWRTKTVDIMDHYE